MLIPTSLRKCLLWGLLGFPLISTAQGWVERIQSGASSLTQTLGELADRTGEAIDQASASVQKRLDAAQETLSDEGTPEEIRARLDRIVERTLKALFQEKPEAQALFEQSLGYGVFDALEASFYLTAGYGRGVLVNRKTEERIYMKMATGGLGLSFGLGGFQRQIVILFATEAALQQFLDRGLTGGAEAGVLMGDEKEQLRLPFDRAGKAIFVLTDSGWKVAAQLTGTKYWRDEPLNLP